MAWPLNQKWFWMLAIGLLVALIVPFFVAWVIMTLRPDLMVVVVVAVLVSWWIFRSYREWSSKMKEEESKEVDFS